MKKQSLEYTSLVFGSLGSGVDIYLPQRQYNEVKLKVSSGKILLEKIDCNNLICDVTSGKIEAKNITSDSIDLNVTSGVIKISNLDTKNVNARITSGTVYIDGNANIVALKASSGTAEFKSTVLPEKIDAQVTSGSVRIYIPENNGFDVNYNVTSGRFSSDFDLMYSNNSNKSGTAEYKQGGNLYTIKVTSGTIKLNRI